MNTNAGEGAANLRTLYVLAIPRTYASRRVGPGSTDIWASLAAGLGDDVAMRLAPDAAELLQTWIKEAFPDVKTAMVSQEEFEAWCCGGGAVPKPLQEPFDFLLRHATGAMIDVVARSNGRARWDWKRAEAHRKG